MIDFLISRGLGAFDSFFKETESSSYLDKVKQIFHFAHLGCDCSFKDSATELFVRKITILSGNHEISFQLLALKEIIALSGRFSLSEEDIGVVMYYASRMPIDHLYALNLSLQEDCKESSLTFLGALQMQLQDPKKSLETSLISLLHRRLLKISLNYRLIQLNLDNLEKKPKQVIEVLDSLRSCCVTPTDRLFISYKVAQFHENYLKTKCRSPEIERRILSITGGD